MPVLVEEMKNRPIDPTTIITDGQNTIYAGIVWHKKRWKIYGRLYQVR